MNEILAGGGLLGILIVAFVVIATILQPVFVILICIRLKRTNKLLERVESALLRPNHNALPSNPIQRVR